MTFLNPIYLWSLLGIILPIAIHLWSRRKVVTIKVGSTKLLRESKPRQTSSIRPNELWLLFLRIMSILLLALIISEPQFHNKTANSPLLYIVEPSLMTSQKMEGFLDGIPEANIRVMGMEFPEVEEYDDSVADNSIPDYWQLAQEMKTLPADSIVVFAEGFISGIKGKRPLVPNHINWIVLNSDDTSDQIVEAKKKGDSLELLTLLSDPGKLQFAKKKLPENSSEVQFPSSKDSIQINGNAIPLSSEEPVHILIVCVDSLVREQQYISAAYRAVSKFLERPISIETVSTIDSINLESFNASIWLGVTPRKDDNKIRLIFKPDPLATELIVPGGTKNEYFLTRFLNSENSVTEHLPEMLYALLNLRESLEKEIRIHDKRAVSAEELRPVLSKKPRTTQQASLLDISLWLWALLLLIMVTERIIAKYRKQ